MKELKFFRCKHCGNFVMMLHASGAPMTCCGEHMHEVVANTTEAATEKHIPVVTVDGDTVTVAVGSVLHPMVEEHFIQWIYLETEAGGQLKRRICGPTCAQSPPWFCSSTAMTFCMKMEGMEETAAVNTMHRSTSGRATG